MGFDGKTLVVTGAASGIGRAVARQAHADGATVVAADFDGDGLDALAGELSGLRTVRADVTRPEDADRIIEAAGERLDVLVNNAAIMDQMLLVDETPEDLWNRVLAVDLTGPFLLCKRAVPLMAAQGGGVIVNVSSAAGLRGTRAGAAYTTAKHGLVGLTKNIAYTFARDGVRCVCVCPGATGHGARGAIEAGTAFSERGLERIVGERGIGAIVAGHPEDVASVILFAASDGAKRINGTVLAADDGATV
jgi:NAD(P)-dependent dehydrogenase (short-subunit alcohol dehydrogenase family)